MIDAPEPVRAIATALDAARASGDGAALAALYTDDGVILLADGRSLRGREAIAAHHAGSAQGAAKKAARGPAQRPPAFKFFFFPPLVHALAAVNGRHGEKHSLLDVYVQQADASYLVAFSSSTLR